jgi:hypothetical protein
VWCNAPESATQSWTQGRVVTWHSQESLWALVSRRYQTGVHGDVPLPRVDVRRPWGSGLAVVAGGSSEGCGGVARVTTTATIAAVVLAAVTTVVVASAGLLFLFRLLVLLGGRDDAEGCGLGVGGAVLV